MTDYAPSAQLCPRCGRQSPLGTDRCPHDRAALAADWTGRVIEGRYTLEKLIGVGGMGSGVWRARQGSAKRTVAVKLMPPGTEEAAERFERGAQIASNLNHPNITTVHDYGRTDAGELFLVMELLEGRELSASLRRGRAMSVGESLRITEQVLQALTHAHRRRVVHRDLKPGNLFLVRRDDEPPSVKVLDFGIARFFDDDDADGSLADEIDKDVTAVRKICGTPRYMSPEQVTRGTVDGRSDLYSVGIVLYRMLTGHVPFDGDLATIMYGHARIPAPPPTDHNPQIPAVVARIVMRALAKRADDRFPDAKAMRQAVRAARIDLGEVTDPSLTSTHGSLAAIEPPSIDTEPAPRRWGLLAALALVLVGVGVAVFLLIQRQDSETPAAPQPVASGAPGVSSTTMAIADAEPRALDLGPPDATADAPIADVAVPDAAVPDAAVPDAVVPDKAREAATRKTSTRTTPRARPKQAPRPTAPAPSPPVAQPAPSPPAQPELPAARAPKVRVIDPGAAPTEPEPAESQPAEGARRKADVRIITPGQ